MLELCRPQVGANMNKQAFKRYLRTMTFNENITVSPASQGTARRAPSRLPHTHMSLP